MLKQFTDNPNTAVITTKYILEQQSPILFVYHYEDDGTWQFSGDDDCDNGDYRVISLEEMINIDNSILELAGMPLGFYAKRNDISSSWEIECFKEKV